MSDPVGRISEAWSPQARVAAEAARRRHHHAPTAAVQRFSANLLGEMRGQGDPVPESVRRGASGLPLTAQHVADLHEYARNAEGAYQPRIDLANHPLNSKIPDAWRPFRSQDRPGQTGRPGR